MSLRVQSSSGLRPHASMLPIAPPRALLLHILLAHSIHVTGWQDEHNNTPSQHGLASSSARPDIGSHMFTSSTGVSVADSTVTSVGNDAHAPSFDTAAETIQAPVNNIGRDQNVYNIANMGADAADKMRGTAVGIMINGKGAHVELLRDNKFTITAANPHGIIEDGESNTMRTSKLCEIRVTSSCTLIVRSPRRACPHGFSGRFFIFFLQSETGEIRSF
ncbi:hypothetical protein LshimejAT787_0212440 [Lyophyllum shimeji]|uniref:Uncharacterized protein n=1 Tax=Lyophyllum shimeji TaxID=47721 RepID=A0A9P3UIK7_LYOSH|nr:hypothetical protein LshimejAT787_0212440 [Lyophyllum shimeji]